MRKSLLNWSRQGWRKPAEHGSGRGPLRAAGLQSLLRAPIWVPAVKDRVSSRGMPGGTSPRANGRLHFQPTSGAHMSLPKSGACPRCSCGGFSLSASCSAMPNGPKVSGGGSLSPRGDWRAPSDASGSGPQVPSARSLTNEAIAASIADREIGFYNFSTELDQSRFYFDTDHLNRTGVAELFTRHLKTILSTPAN